MKVYGKMLIAIIAMDLVISLPAVQLGFVNDADILMTFLGRSLDPVIFVFVQCSIFFIGFMVLGCLRSKNIIAQGRFHLFDIVIISLVSFIVGHFVALVPIIIKSSVNFIEAAMLQLSRNTRYELYCLIAISLYFILYGMAVWRLNFL